MKGNETPSAGRRGNAKRSTPRKSVNEVPPPSRINGLDTVVRIVREGRPATIFDRME